MMAKVPNATARKGMPRLQQRHRTARSLRNRPSRPRAQIIRLREYTMTPGPPSQTAPRQLRRRLPHRYVRWEPRRTWTWWKAYPGYGAPHYQQRSSSCCGGGGSGGRAAGRRGRSLPGWRLPSRAGHSSSTEHGQTTTFAHVWCTGAARWCCRGRGGGIGGDVQLGQVPESRGDIPPAGGGEFLRRSRQRGRG